MCVSPDVLPRVDPTMNGKCAHERVITDGGYRCAQMSENGEMTACDCAAETSRLSVRPSAVTRLGHAVLRLVTLWRNRRTFRRLSEMTDAELADIGITRADLDAATEVSLSDDPTARLMAIADARAGLTAAAKSV